MDTFAIIGVLNTHLGSKKKTIILHSIREMKVISKVAWCIEKCTRYSDIKKKGAAQRNRKDSTTS